jgi:hypothetical protein
VLTRESGARLDARTRDQVERHVAHYDTADHFLSGRRTKRSRGSRDERAPRAPAHATTAQLVLQIVDTPLQL